METFRCVISVESAESVIETLKSGDLSALQSAIEAAPAVRPSTSKSRCSMFHERPTHPPI